jgi:hypothetical protein
MPSSGRLGREELYRIASYQKAVLLCVLVSLGVVAGQFALPEGSTLLVIAGLAVVGVISAVFVFLLATSLFGNGLGAFLGVLTLVPYLGLVVLLFVNGKATAVLKEHGIRVGLLGADLSKLK